MVLQTRNTTLIKLRDIFGQNAHRGLFLDAHPVESHSHTENCAAQLELVSSLKLCSSIHLKTLCWVVNLTVFPLFIRCYIAYLLDKNNLIGWGVTFCRVRVLDICALGAILVLIFLKPEYLCSVSIVTDFRDSKSDPYLQRRYSF